MHNFLSIHNTDKIHVQEIRGAGSSFSLDIRISDKEGNHFEIVLFSDNRETLASLKAGE